MIKHITREEAIRNAKLWVADEGLSVEECAKRMRLTRTTMYAWLKDAGLRYEVKCAHLVPVNGDR